MTVRHHHSLVRLGQLARTKQGNRIRVRVAVPEDSEHVDLSERSSTDGEGGSDSAHANEDHLASRSCALLEEGVVRRKQRQRGGGSSSATILRASRRARSA